VPQKSSENTLSVCASVCQPQGGVPKCLVADLSKIFCNKTIKTAAKCLGQIVPQKSSENTLSVYVGVCQPQGGVPKCLVADLSLIFCNKTIKTAAKCLGQHV
jgi:hypothetical protein